ncbi:hypothetical protein [Dactylosporangium salmoneum]|uniref:hypothetical protein n=1 Tax=Dactylosporangium salmoneum TaxID=53361 RepID=UPI0031D33E3D
MFLRDVSTAVTVRKQIKKRRNEYGDHGADPQHSASAAGRAPPSRLAHRVDFCRRQDLRQQPIPSRMLAVRVAGRRRRADGGVGKRRVSRR